MIDVDLAEAQRQADQIIASIRSTPGHYRTLGDAVDVGLWLDIMTPPYALDLEQLSEQGERYRNAVLSLVAIGLCG